MDFIKINIAKLNFPKPFNACERRHHWLQAVFLLMHYVEYGKAANTMVQHSPSAVMHDQFQSIM